MSVFNLFIVFFLSEYFWCHVMMVVLAGERQQFSNDKLVHISMHMNSDV